ncbi:uncharacterized protein J7T54_007113 [Emericellopsis cladophorae]|uniref:Integral membrane protein n=1 Tax=Emericellopsis cladophorae TaxID=2686198 RepID=A0A9P9Y8X9_9HYPO|nr:uncharacterized protein J7T54_007113 [Emericellopsis cladophorae]KAI6785470.1 hypothetical protein J7T54_007113 [Emericellopsis cladophorae]
MTAVMIPDFGILPPCAVDCGALYGANNRCVPPAVPASDMATYTECFCADSAVSSLATSLTVCSDVCPEGQSMGLIQQWFQRTCNIADSGDSNGSTEDDTSTGDDTTTGDDTSEGDSNGGTGTTGNEGGGTQGGNGGANARPTTTGTADYSNAGGDWLSNHWQWIVMLVVLVVAIVGIWVGACIWRRRYLKKKEHQRTWNQKQSGSQTRPSWGPGDPRAAEAGKVLARPSMGGQQPSDSSDPAGVFMPKAEAQPAETPSWKFWKR